MSTILEDLSEDLIERKEQTFYASDGAGFSSPKEAQDHDRELDFAKWYVGNECEEVPKARMSSWLRNNSKVVLDLLDAIKTADIPRSSGIRDNY